MASKTHMTVKITSSALIAQERHTEWEIAQEAGRLRNGRPYLSKAIQGYAKTRKGQSKSACRGKVSY